MKIYIAASWKHEHAVVMLTMLLRQGGHEVKSFVEDGRQRNVFQQDFESWLRTDDSQAAFNHDSSGALECDCLIYIGPSGQDACTEVGMAYGAQWCTAKPKLMIALDAKGEQYGLMRKVFDFWVDDVMKVIHLVNKWPEIKENPIDPESLDNTVKVIQ